MAADPSAIGEPLPGAETLGDYSHRRGRLARLVPVTAPECDVSVVFPCRNEESSVGFCVLDARVRLEAARVDGEVVVCDNASTDSSLTVAEEAGARVITEDRPGYGRALAAGIRAARGKYIIMADADASYDLGAVKPMLEALDAGADLVMGNRFRGAIKPGAMPWTHRYIGGPIFRWLVNLFFGTSIGDVHCGMRAFTRDAWERMALHTTGMEFASEMVARAARGGLTIAEVPVDYHPRAGVSKLRTYRDGWRHLRFLLMYSPTWLYMIPSALLSALGLYILIALSLGPLDLFNRRWDMHLAAVASLLTVLGIQVAWLGISARTLAVIHGFDPEDRFIAGFYKRFTLETGLAIAGGCFVAGLAMVLWLGWHWAAGGFSALDQIRPLLLAVTLIMIGVQSAFNAFFLSLLGVETRAIES